MLRERRRDRPRFVSRDCVRLPAALQCRHAASSVGTGEGTAATMSDGISVPSFISQTGPVRTSWRRLAELAGHMSSSCPCGGKVKPRLELRHAARDGFIYGLIGRRGETRKLPNASATTTDTVRSYRKSHLLVCRHQKDDAQSARLARWYRATSFRACHGARHLANQLIGMRTGSSFPPCGGYHELRPLSIGVRKLTLG